MLNPELDNKLPEIIGKLKTREVEKKDSIPAKSDRRPRMLNKPVLYRTEYIQSI